MKRLIANKKTAASADNVAWVENLNNHKQIKIDLKDDDISEKLEELTDGFNYDYEVVDIDCEIDGVWSQYMNERDLLILQEILNDKNVDKDVIEAYLELESNDLEEAYDCAVNSDFIAYYCDDDDEDLGRYLVDEFGMPEDPQSYFDYESYGRDVRLSDGLAYHKNAFYYFY